jgi:hypothetical protein
VGLEEHGRERLCAVLTCPALYGGNLHLATVPLAGAAVPVATESLYRVHYDWRANSSRMPSSARSGTLTAWSRSATVTADPIGAST